MGQQWLELGTIKYDFVDFRGWLFQPDNGSDPHRAVTEFYPATKDEPAKLVFKYYRVIDSEAPYYIADGVTLEPLDGFAEAYTDLAAAEQYALKDMPSYNRALYVVGRSGNLQSLIYGGAVWVMKK